MTRFSLILGAVAAVTAAAGEQTDESSSRQPLAVLIQGGATLKDDVLALHGPWKGRPEDLHLLGELPDRIKVEVWGWSLPDDGLKHLRGAKLKRHRLSLREGDAGMECLRQCGRIEEIVICRSSPPPQDWAVSLEDTLAHLKGIAGLRKLTVCWYQPLTTAEMARMGELTDLQELNLDFPPITREAFAQLTGLVRLKKLVLSASLTGSAAAALAGLAELPSLESVSLPFFVDETALVGLKYLRRLKSLDVEFAWMTDVGVEHLADLATLESLHLQAHNSDADLSPLGRLSNLRSLSFVGTARTDADVACFGELANLESLDLSWTKVTDAGLAHLARLSKLKSLKLMGGNVSDAGIEQIAKLADLETLVVSSDDFFNPMPPPRYVTDAGLSHLARLSKLKSLSLAHSLRVTDSGIAHLANLTNLEALNLSGARVSDAGIAHLANLTNLVSLDLSHTRVTDAGLSHLARLSKLKSLNLDGTNVTDAGIECLANLVDPASLDASSAAAAGSGTPPPALSNLEFLSLRRTKVVGTRLHSLAFLPRLESLQVSGQELTDAALEQTADLRNLRTLWVGGPLVTHDGLMHLTRLPHLEQLAITANTPVTDISAEAIEAARTAELPYVEIRLGVTDGAGLAVFDVEGAVISWPSNPPLQNGAVSRGAITPRAADALPDRK